MINIELFVQQYYSVMLAEYQKFQVKIECVLILNTFTFHVINFIKFKKIYASVCNITFKHFNYN